MSRVVTIMLAIVVVLPASRARAIPVPLSDQTLATMSDAVVEGQVVLVTYLGKQIRGEYEVSSYRSELQVARVLKGKLRPGAVLVLLWQGETWVGKGVRPTGRAPQPFYLTCEKVRTHLRAVPGKNAYVTVEWNARRQLAPQPPGSSWLSEQRRTLRCVNGKVK